MAEILMMTLTPQLQKVAIKKNHIKYSRSNSRNTQYRNNYSRSNTNRPIVCLISVPIHTLGIDTIQMIDQEIHHTIDI